MVAGRPGDLSYQQIAFDVLSAGESDAHSARQWRLSADHERDDRRAKWWQLGSHISGGPREREERVHSTQVGRGKTGERCARNAHRFAHLAHGLRRRFAQ